MDKTIIRLFTVWVAPILSVAVFGCSFNYFGGDDDDETAVTVDDDDDNDNTAPDLTTNTTDDDDDTILGSLTNNGNGTATDGETGLMWQNPPSNIHLNWLQAIDYCESLDLGGRTDWHLPTISELRSLIRDCPYTVTDGSCGVTDDCLDSSCRDSSCGGCAGSEPCYWDVTLEGDCSWYWSSSEQSDDVNNAWDVMYDNSYFANDDKLSTFNARCVRNN
jgi:Protein of unknown function (DUF1566)